MKTPRSLEFPEKCASLCAFGRAVARASCMVAPRWGLLELALPTFLILQGAFPLLPFCSFLEALTSNSPCKFREEGEQRSLVGWQDLRGKSGEQCLPSPDGEGHQPSTDPVRLSWGFSHEARRGPQGASRVAPGKSGPHEMARGSSSLLSSQIGRAHV